MPWTKGGSSTHARAKPLAGMIGRTPKGHAMIRIVYNRLLGGWFVVRGPHQTPLVGRYPTRQAAEASLTMRAERRRLDRLIPPAID